MWAVADDDQDWTQKPIVKLAGNSPELKKWLPAVTVLNVNIPDLPLCEIRGLRPTRMGRRDYEDEIVRRLDPHGVPYYWIGGSDPAHVAGEGTDFDAVENGYVSATPLHRDLTNYASLGELGHLKIGLPDSFDVRLDSLRKN